MTARKSGTTSPHVSRRAFAGVAAATAVALTAKPAAARARRLGNETIIGTGAHQFRVRHNFPQLPDTYTWQITHNVAVDSAGNLYVIHEGHKDRKDHPAIFVFDPTGKFIRAFGSEFQGGGHGIEVVQRQGRGHGSDDRLGATIAEASECAVKDRGAGVPGVSREQLDIGVEDPAGLVGIPHGQQDGRLGCRAVGLQGTGVRQGRPEDEGGTVEART